MMDFIPVVLWWAAYCALHSYLISVRFSAFMSRVMGRLYPSYRLLYVVLSVALLVPLIQYTSSVDDGMRFRYPAPLDALTNVLSAVSVLAFAWAFFVDYDCLHFLGLRQILTMTRTEESSKTISKKGLLGVVRHPMYSALTVYLWCNIRSLMDLVVAGLLTAYVAIGTLLEERKLVLEYGDAYADYQREVPMLIPFIRPRAR